MPKIAIFMNSLSGGGMERAILNLASFFVSEGASVDLLVASAKGPLLEEVPASINLVDLGAGKSKFSSVRWWFLKAMISVEPWFFVLCFTRKLPKAIKVIPGLIAYLNDNSPDAILSTPTTANLAVIWAKIYSGYDKKVIVREASTLTNELQNKDSLFFRLIKRFVRKWYNHADTVICVSDGVSRDLSNNFLVHSKKLQTIYNILDVQKIKNKSILHDYDSMIKGFGNYILGLGRLEPQKDFETLIRSFHLIANDVSVNLVILGEGSERDYLEELIDELSLNNRIFLPGFFINPYPFIANCSVFALSSRWEGCPNVLREALVLKRKIVSTDCPSGAREILANGELGELVEVGNINQFSDGLHNLLNVSREPEEALIDGMNNLSINQYRKIFSL